MNILSNGNFSHQQVFGHLKDELFTAIEAAEYLEVSIATFRRYLKSGKLISTKKIGANYLYLLKELREFKKAIVLLKS